MEKEKVIIKYTNKIKFWVIVTPEEPNFWMYNFSTLSEAKAYCASQNWEIIKVYKT